MFNTVCEDWVVNLDTMSCWNSNWDITITFERQGKSLVGKINYMPDSLLKYWAFDKDGYEELKNMVMQAEDIFLRAFCENDIKKNGIPEDIMLEMALYN